MLEMSFATDFAAVNRNQIGPMGLRHVRDSRFDGRTLLGMVRALDDVRVEQRTVGDSVEDGMIQCRLRDQLNHRRDDDIEAVMIVRYVHLC